MFARSCLCGPHGRLGHFRPYGARRAHRGEEEQEQEQEQLGQVWRLLPFGLRSNINDFRPDRITWPICKKREAEQHVAQQRAHGSKPADVHEQLIPVQNTPATLELAFQCGKTGHAMEDNVCKTCRM